MTSPKRKRGKIVATPEAPEPWIPYRGLDRRAAVSRESWQGATVGAAEPRAAVTLDININPEHLAGPVDLRISLPGQEVRTIPLDLAYHAVDMLATLRSIVEACPCGRVIQGHMIPACLHCTVARPVIAKATGGQP